MGAPARRWPWVQGLTTAALLRDALVDPCYTWVLAMAQTMSDTSGLRPPRVLSAKMCRTLCTLFARATLRHPSPRAHVVPHSLIVIPAPPRPAAAVHLHPTAYLLRSPKMVPHAMHTLCPRHVTQPQPQCICGAAQSVTQTARPTAMLRDPRTPRSASAVFIIQACASRVAMI